MEQWCIWFSTAVKPSVDAARPCVRHLYAETGLPCRPGLSAIAQIQQTEVEAPTPKTERRVKLYSWDAVAAQLLEPFGESSLDSLSLQQLWKAASEGNKKAAYHSHLCADKATDMWHVGAGVSTTAAAIQAAVKNLETEDMKRLLRPELHEKIMAEALELKPILEKLNIGKGSQKQDAAASGTMRQAKRAKTGTSTIHAYSEEEVIEAAKKFHGDQGLTGN